MFLTIITGSLVAITPVYNMRWAEILLSPQTEKSRVYANLMNAQYCFLKKKHGNALRYILISYKDIHYILQLCQSDFTEGNLTSFLILTVVVLLGLPNAGYTNKESLDWCTIFPCCCVVLSSSLRPDMVISCTW